MSKFSYSTKLNPSEKTANRVSLIGNGVMMTVIDGKRAFCDIDVNALPFTASVHTAYTAVINNTEHEYFNIGTRPEEHFELQDPDLLHINYIMFLIAMRQAHARHTWFKSLPQYFTSYVRESILSSTYIHRLKLVTVQALYSGYTPRRHNRLIRELYVANGFPAETAVLYMLYWISGEAQRTIEALLEVKEPFILDFESLLEEANIIISESNLESLAKYEASKRLTFIANSNRLGGNDFAQELLNRSRQSYLQCRPFLGRQHSLNYARSTISTYSLRIIQHYTDPARARLITNPDGSHDNRFTSLDEAVEYIHESVEDKMAAHIDNKIELLGDAFFAR